MPLHFISLGDFWKLFKKKKRFLLFFTLGIGTLFCAYALLQPLRYPGEGVFKLASPTSGVFASTLSSLMGNEKGLYSAHDDPRNLLLSFPVLEKAVHALHLQGNIHQNSIPLWKRMWTNIKLESSFARLRSKSSPSPLIPRHLLIPDSPLVVDPLPALSWKGLKYGGEVLKQLDLYFLDEQNFEVFDKKHSIGSGKIGHPFSFAEGEFTLNRSSTNLTSQFFTLSFLPIKNVVGALQKTLLVKKDKKSPQLLNIHYTLGNRQMAAAVVNAVMDSYQLFITELAQKKIEKQIAYLHQRKKASLHELEMQMKEHEKYLVRHIHRGGFLTLKEEASFMMEKQARYIETLTELTSQIEKLGALPEFEIEKMEAIHLEKKEVEELLKGYRKEFDKIEHQKRNYTQILDHLALPVVELGPLTALCDDSTLLTLCQQIQTLQSQIVDEHNFTQKERTYFQEELQNKKRILENKLTYLMEASSKKMLLLTEKISALKGSYLHLLQQEIERVETLLKDLQTVEACFPEKWFQEEKLHLNVEISRALIEQISKGIEGRNIAFHMESLDSYPLEYALPSPLPKPPYLCLFFMAGCLLGGGMYVFFLLWETVREGASTSLKNMQERGLKVVGSFIFPYDIPWQERGGHEQRLLKEIFFHLMQNSEKQKSTVVLMTGKEPAFYKKSLFGLFPSLLHVDLTEINGLGLADYLNKKSPLLPLTFQGNVTYLPLGEGANFIEGILQSPAFKELLTELQKMHGLIFIETRGSLDSIKNKILYSYADHILCVVGEEKLQEASQLPAKTLFIHKESKSAENAVWSYWEGEKKLYFKEIKPLLDKLQNAWRN